MTPGELKEWKYRRDERLGILCEDKIPTVSERAIALMDANKWLEAIRKQEHEDIQNNH